MTDNPNPPGETGVEESDPNADSVDGLAGDMGVSSERVGPVKGDLAEGTYGGQDTSVTERDPDDPDASAPERSADPATGEPTPDNDVPAHPRNPEGNPGHL